jgi:hypothetical protein
MLSALSHAASDRLERILSPQHTLCKEDIIWVLDFIKNKMVEEDPRLLALPQPRLLTNFLNFAEAAMLIIHSRPVFDQESDRLKHWIAEACYGLTIDSNSS